MLFLRVKLHLVLEVESVRDNLSFLRVVLTRHDLSFLVQVNNVFVNVLLVGGLAAGHKFFISAFRFQHSRRLNGVILLDNSVILGR